MNVRIRCLLFFDDKLSEFDDTILCLSVCNDKKHVYLCLTAKYDVYICLTTELLCVSAFNKKILCFIVI